MNQGGLSITVGPVVIVIMNQGDLTMCSRPGKYDAYTTVISITMNQGGLRLYSRPGNYSKPVIII